MKTVTLHYMPLVYTIVILISTGLTIAVAFASIGYFNFHEEKTEVIECHYFEQGECTKVYSIQTDYCTFDLIEFKQDCSQRENDIKYWLQGLIAIMIINGLWYFAMFFVANDSKRWIRFDWVE